MRQQQLFAAISQFSLSIISAQLYLLAIYLHLFLVALLPAPKWPDSFTDFLFTNFSFLQHFSRFVFDALSFLVRRWPKVNGKIESKSAFVYLKSDEHISLFSPRLNRGSCVVAFALRWRYTHLLSLCHHQCRVRVPNIISRPVPSAWVGLGRFSVSVQVSDGQLPFNSAPVCVSLLCS